MAGSMCAYAQALRTVIAQDSLGKLNIYSGLKNWKQLNIFGEGSRFKQQLFLEKPTFVYALRLTNGADKKLTREYYGLLLLPGDSVFIDKDKQVHSSMGYSLFIDSLLTLRQQDYAATSAQREEQLKDGLKGAIQQFQTEYVLRKNKIDALNTLTAAQRQILHDFNEQLLANKISGIAQSVPQPKQDEIKLLDSCARQFEANMAGLTRVDGSNQLSIYFFLIRYNAFKRGVMGKDFWDFAFQVDQSMQQKAYYLPYLFLMLENGYNDPNLPGILLEKLPASLVDGSSLNTFRQVLVQLDRSLEDYQSAKQGLEGIAGGKYAYLLSSTRNEQRNIAALKGVLMIDYQDKEIDFSRNIMGTEAKITVIDVWAQWCIPCLQDYPLLQEIKQIYKPKGVRFISLSLDTDKDQQAWKNMVDKLNGVQTDNQYRIPDKDKKLLVSYFNISPIPRYIVVDRSGKVLAYDFFRPGDAKFKTSLDRFLAGK